MSRTSLNMSSSGTFVDRIDPFAKRSLKKKQKKSQGSSRYRTGGDVELTALPLLKGQFISVLRIFCHFLCSTIFIVLEQGCQKQHKKGVPFLFVLI